MKITIPNVYFCNFAQRNMHTNTNNIIILKISATIQVVTKGIPLENCYFIVLKFIKLKIPFANIVINELLMCAN